MAKKVKKVASDFRYDTGKARVPWAAVGEVVRGQDVMNMVKFLIPAGDGKQTAYAQQLKKVEKEIDALADLGGFAGKLSLGNNVEALEKKCCSFLKAKHSLFLTNCTAGFEIAHQFAGLKPGDEVIAPALTFIATIAYPLSIGAKVVLADVDPMTHNIDPADVKRKITSKTKVIIPVHIGGYPADMAPIMALANKHNITVLEDGAHSFGASYKGKMVGTIGHFGAFSFHEVKNLTSLGEGGILCTNSAKFGKQFPQARFLGLNMAKKIPLWLYDVDPLETVDGGFTAPGNHSATEIQALCLINQMSRLKGIIAKRKKAAQYLNKRLGKVDGIILPPGDSKDIKSAYHLYQLIVAPDRIGGDIQDLKKKLDARGIVQIPHFAPLYKFNIMRKLGYDTAAMEASCPVAEDSFRHRFTHLPLYDFSTEQLDYMAQAIIDSVEEIKAGR
ncbi:MAG: DegT/DnrJ/EryC1/StrS family aminotransferase [Sedimentisphaerales bacterium]|nr:DegT/DnrJ/EryC1/StrS family aminotransferase [Sedimentisphaerales bacterium]